MISLTEQRFSWVALDTLNIDGPSFPGFRVVSVDDPIDQIGVPP